MSIPSVRPKIEPRKQDRRNGASWRRLQEVLRQSAGNERLPLTSADAVRQREKREAYRMTRARPHGRWMEAVIVLGLVVLILAILHHTAVQFGW